MDPDTTSCANGHQMDLDDVFCGQCGAPTERDLLDDEPQWAEPGPAGTDAPTVEQSHPLRAVVLAGLVVLVVVGGIIWVTKDNGGSDGSAATSAAATSEPTTTISITNQCQVELLAWVDHATQPGNSIMDVAAEFGTQSPEWVIVNDAWETFESNRFQVGRSQATQDAIDHIETGCTNLGDRFVPGSLPPP